MPYSLQEKGLYEAYNFEDSSAQEKRLLKIAIQNSLVEQTLKASKSAEEVTTESENPIDSIEEVKTYYPTEEQFKEPMKYIEYLTTQEEAHRYGTVKIVPPSSFRPHLAFDMFSSRRLPTRY